MLAGLLILIFSSSCHFSQNWRNDRSCFFVGFCNVGGCLRFGQGNPKGECLSEKIQILVLFTIECDAFHVGHLLAIQVQQTCWFSQWPYFQTSAHVNL